MPKFLLFLSKAEGIPSQSHAVSGTLFSTFKSIKKDPNALVDLLATSLPDNATYFLTFVALKFFIGYGLELSGLFPLIIFHIKRKCLCKSEAEVKAACILGILDMGLEYPVIRSSLQLSSATLLLLR
ncbi:membrane protein-like [Pyrus ussuriensis x Pyrus communis]|uniref:Membrane protein-like n=1 Tax=Pyrus ussuriensis x Pyrus communis TaxID=2448454 RepID=A0A5N5FEI3_9ROSA|nr:membrane protein-like [Pyrus ussuriensis x Pyrus communis]